jgi:hypothetical protein
MSIFLEDKISSNINIEKINEFENDFKNNSNEIKEYCSDLNEAIAYQEAAWSNIIIVTMQEEYKLIKEEKNLNEASKKLFEKVIEWCKNFFEKIKNTINNSFNKLVLMCTNALSYIKKHGKIDDMSNIEVPDNYRDKTLEITEMTLLTGNNSKDYEVSEYLETNIKDICDSINDYIETLDFIKIERKEKIEIKYSDLIKNKKLLDNAYSNLSDGNVAVKNVKKNIDCLTAELRVTERIAKIGISVSKSLKQSDEEKINKCQEEVKENKEKIIKYNRAISVLLSYSATTMISSLKIYNIAIKLKNNIVKNEV